jgi:hypothetical protein
VARANNTRREQPQTERTDVRSVDGEFSFEGQLAIWLHHKSVFHPITRCVLTKSGIRLRQTDPVVP